MDCIGLPSAISQSPSLSLLISVTPSAVIIFMIIRTLSVKMGRPLGHDSYRNDWLMHVCNAQVLKPGESRHTVHSGTRAIQRKPILLSDVDDSRRRGTNDRISHALPDRIHSPVSPINLMSNHD